ncbi:type II toxin-antitoxin system BrnA family antitoxin [Sulfurimonas sp.]|uniref:type II toxin-antitoxin system BrnA family antitoxin n=1 Tax=Sulfurimonas sp. TaxID=2022749 RepID=UPI00286E6BFB|nr:CopG family antitoxin [Sulfurimonas sp.]
MKTAREFDELFESGDDITEFVDYSKGYRPNLVQKRINLDLPLWMIEGLDKEAKRLGVARQAIMKMFLAQHLEKAI